jgi:hypothetical protein
MIRPSILVLKMTHQNFIRLSQQNSQRGMIFSPTRELLIVVSHLVAYGKLVGVDLWHFPTLKILKWRAKLLGH